MFTDAFIRLTLPTIMKINCETKYFRNSFLLQSISHFKVMKGVQ